MIVKQEKIMLSKNIKKFRVEQKLTQEELAQKSGVKYSTLIKLESGYNTNPKLDALLKLSKNLKIGLDKLVGIK